MGSRERLCSAELSEAAGSIGPQEARRIERASSLAPGCWLSGTVGGRLRIGFDLARNLSVYGSTDAAEDRAVTFRAGHDLDMKPVDRGHRILRQIAHLHVPPVRHDNLDIDQTIAIT